MVTMRSNVNKKIGSMWPRVCVITACTVSLLAIAFYQSVSAIELTHGSRTFNRHAYVTTGLGFSHLDPDTSEVSQDVNDRVNAAGQIGLGLDVNRWFSLELHSADLGSAGLSPRGRINYHVHGGSALVYLGKNRSAHARTGLSAYARTGFGYLDNSAVGEVEFEQRNAIHWLFGGGIEYVTRFGLGARAEIFSFDEDAMYGQLALTYRFGRKQQLKQVAVNDTATETPLIPTLAAVVVANDDRDADGVLDTADECPTTSFGVSVDETGCALFAGVAQGVNFHEDSAMLTSDAKVILDEVVATLERHKSITATISAHTDSVGSERYNQNLSELRARSVRYYLNRNGVRQARLKVSAHGETQPIQTNATAEGRRLNRRVEIVALNGQ